MVEVPSCRHRYNPRWPSHRAAAMTKKLLLAFSLAWLATVAWALPTVDQVQVEVRNGNYAQAETMMREVVDAKPGSAKAHYLYAEILAHNGSFAKASDEAKRAKQIDPEIKFTQPEKYRAFEQLLERESNAAPRASSGLTRMASPAAAAAPAAEVPRAAAIPSWVWIAGLGVVGFMLWRGFARSREAGQAAQVGSVRRAGPAYGNGYNTGFGNPGAPGMPYGAGMPAAPSASSGLLGTGLAVAGGVAAGMLVDEMLHRRQEPGVDHLGELGPANNAFDAPFVDDTAREIENRPIDFGNGDDWDAGSAPDAGGADDGGWT